MLVDTNNRDTAAEIWGHKTSAPIGFSPIGINKIYHPLGELPVAKVAKELNLPYCLSTAGSTAIEDVGKANGEGTRFFQVCDAEAIRDRESIGLIRIPVVHASP